MRDPIRQLICLTVITAVAAPSTIAQTTGPASPPGGTSPAGDYRAAIAPYIGSWQSDQKEGPDGSSFHFRYDVAWFDDARTILEITVTQRFSDNSEQLFWTGFKGWSAAEGDTYYIAFSPQRGKVEGRVFRNEAGELVTSYVAYGPDGRRIRVRDIMSPVEEGTFRAVTHLSTDGGPWRAVVRDRWTRLEAAG